MSKAVQDQTTTGPQGTQLFDVDEINKLVAAKIANEKSAENDTPSLIGLNDSFEGQKFILDQHKIEVGRRPNSDLVLDNASVSSMHAQLINDGENWKVLNLLSSNGTYVNGEKIVEKTIVAGDRVSFAEAEFVFSYVKKEAAKNTTDPQGSKLNKLLLVGGVILIAAGLAFLY